LRFYDESDFQVLGQLASPRLWSNRLTLAAILVALVLWQCAVPVLAKVIYFVSRRTDQNNAVGLVERSSCAAWKIEPEKQIAELKLKNKRLAELESKLNEILHS